MFLDDFQFESLVKYVLLYWKSSSYLSLSKKLGQVASFLVLSELLENAEMSR